MTTNEIPVKYAPRSGSHLGGIKSVWWARSDRNRWAASSESADGTPLTDSHVIIEHFDRLAGESSLWPRDRTVRSRSAALLGLAQTACEKAVQLVYERELRPAEKQYAEWTDRVIGQVSAACELLEERIDPEALWLAPGRPAQAGLSLAVACTFMQHRIPDIWIEGRFARLQTFRAEAEELAVFRRWPHASPSKPLAQAPLNP